MKNLNRSTGHRNIPHLMTKLPVIGAGLLVFLSALPTATFGGLPRQLAVPGGIIWIELPASLPVGSSAHFLQNKVLIIETEKSRLALVGLPLDLPTGEQQIEFTAPGIAPVNVPFQVKEKRYPTQHVKITDPGKVLLSVENEARVATEHAEIRRLKSTWTARQLNLAAVDFVAPANGKRSGRFGARRFFNGVPRAPHVGLDFAVARGTAIHSAAAGKVLAVGDYFFNGKTVFVDHGQGLITMYCHLDQVAVEVGQALQRGQRLGAAGSTGRASGPHLHWSVILNGAMIDPERFLDS